MTLASQWRLRLKYINIRTLFDKNAANKKRSRTDAIRIVRKLASAITSLTISRKREKQVVRQRRTSIDSLIALFTVNYLVRRRYPAAFRMLIHEARTPCRRQKADGNVSFVSVSLLHPRSHNRGAGRLGEIRTRTFSPGPLRNTGNPAGVINIRHV